MKEFEGAVKEVNVGLRLRDTVEGYSVLRNLEPYPTGLRQVTSLSGDLVSGEWPKYLTTDYYLLKFVKSGSNIHLYEDTTFVQNLGAISRVHVAGIGRYYLLICENSSGTLTQWERLSDGLYAGPSSGIPLSRTAYFFNGQLVAGGFTTPAGELADLGPGYVGWSSIGRVDFRPSLYRDAGYLPVPWLDQGEGEVWWVGPLGKGLVVFGSGGYGVMAPVSQPVSGWTFKQVEHTLMLGATACHSVEAGAVCVTSKYELILVNPEGQIAARGYEEFFEPLCTTGHSLHITYDKAERRWFFTNGLKCYCLSSMGLFEVGQLVYSVVRFKGVSYAAVGAASSGWELVTGDQDFGFQSIKSLESVAVDIRSSDASLKGVAQYSLGGSWSETSSMPLNPSGIGHPRIAGVKHRVGLSGTGTFTHLNSIRLRIKTTDKRFIRGVTNASAANN